MRNTSKLILSAAVATTVASLLPASARAATVTWTGAVADPSSAAYVATAQGTAAGFVSGQNLYLWNTSALNWSGAPTYTVGDNVIFTDNFAGGTDIRLPSGNMNPTSMTFQHIPGAVPANYRFLNSSGTLGSADFYTSVAQTANLGQNSPFGAAASTTLTLDTGFLGSVALRHRSNSATTFGNTIIRSGTLIVQDGGALPHSGVQNQPAVTLDGGELQININTNTNTNPAAAQLGGALTVLSDSTLSNAEATRTALNQGASMWNGPVTMGAGITLTLKSYTTVRANLSNMNISNIAGTIRLADVGGNVSVIGVNNQTSHDALNGLIDLGTDSSEIVNTGGNLTYDWGALQGGANTKISGSPTAAGTGTFSIGARGDSTTYAGILRDSPVLVTGLVALTKVGTGTLTLTGASTHTGATAATGLGTLLLSGANGSVVNSPVSINQGGTLSINNASNNNNRLSDTLALTMNQGTLNFQGNLAAPTAELAGALTIAGGSNVVQTTDTGLGSPASLTFASLGGTGGVVDFKPQAAVNIALTSSSLTNGILGGYATANLNDWATVSGGNIAAYGAYTANTAPNTWVAADNINLTTGGTSTVAASTGINSLRFAGTGTTVSIDAAQTLNTGLGILATGTGNATISGAGSLTAGTGAAEMIVTVPTAGNTLTISAPIADNGGGAVSLIKAGAGKLLLSGTGSTFTGGTQLIGGTLQVGVANYFPVGSNLTINYNTSFDIGGFNQSFGTVALIDGSLLNSGGAASVSATTAYDVRNGTVSAALGGAAPLNKTTGSTVTLSGANTYTGGTNVTGGTLAAGATNTLPTTGAVTVSNGATLNVGAFNETIGTLTVGNLTTSAGNVNGTSGVITPTSVAAQNGTINAIIGGTTGVTKAGINTTVTLNGLNTYTGPTTVTASANSGTLAINTIANGGAPSSLGASSNASTNLVLAGPMTLSYTGTGASTDRLFDIGGGAATIGSNGTGPLNFTNTGTIGGASSSVLTLTGSNTGANIFSPLLTAPNVSGLTKGGNSNWTITNNNNAYTGVTSIGGAGALSVAAFANGGVASPLGAATSDAANLVLNGGILRYTGTGHTTDRLFTMNNNGTLDASGTGAVNFNNTGATAFTGTGTRTLTLTGSNTDNNTLASLLGNPIGNTFAITKTGAGKWVLSNTNTYTGATTVNAGTLAMTNGLKSGTSLTIANGGTMVVPESTPNTYNPPTDYPSGSNTTTSKVNALTIGATGTLDLGNNDMAIDYVDPNSPLDTVRDLLTSGYNGGGWDGFGIISNTVNVNNANQLDPSIFGLGYAENGALPVPYGNLEAQGGPLFGDQDVDLSAVLVKFTWVGDLNLDGFVDFGDLSVFNTNYDNGATSGRYWFEGDFNYDGLIDFGDLSLFNTNYDPTKPSLPEPGAMSVLAAAAGLGALRRRRRSA